MTAYQAFVKVEGLHDDSFWSPLAPPRPTREAAVADRNHYVMSKASGANGFAKGPVGETRIGVET